MKPILFLLAATLSSLSFAAGVKEPIYGQVLFGQLNLTDGTVKFDSNGETIEGELPDSIPYLGAAAQVVWKDDIIGYGWEGGGFFSWQNDKVYYNVSTGGSGTTVRIAVDNQYWSFETFLGLYASFRPTERIRFYASGGPLFMFATTKAKDVEEPPEVAPVSGNSIDIEVDSYHSDFTMGGYVRAGFDIQLQDNFWIGVSARHMKASLDFPQSLGKFNIDGNQYFLSVTQKY